MKKIIFVPVLLLLLFGCTKRHDYLWHEYYIAPDRITSEINHKNSQPIKVAKGVANEAEKLLGEVGPHEYYSNDQELTNGMAEQLTLELRKMGLKISDTSEKSIEVRVNRTEYERGMWKLAATLDFTVTLGDGMSKTFTVRNSSPTSVDRTYDGAIALAVIKIINDTEISAYINK